MFNATILDTKSWKNSMEAIVALIDEGTLSISKDGMKLRAMDPSQIALVDFHLPVSAYEKYEIDEEIKIGVDFVELSKITRRARAGDKIELSFNNNRLGVVFLGETIRRFNLSVIESESDPPREPKIDFSAEVKISANVLKDALKDAELISNHVAISANDGFLMSAEGDTGSVNINIPTDNIMSINVKDSARAVFSLDQLNNLLKASDVGSIVSLKLRTDSPLRVEYAIGEGRVVYYLAPRIESV